ncbi:MAG: 2-oxoacid:acceptor oxidoreductase family protein [Thermoplasmatales archaeon]|jgi:pyruvate ferredoxin oxidoreductase gamma subunit/2-oxoisovalerate ferredoxin oxidoreductase gamma subunit|nr:MAG: 2-oxoacid:acceptor oxidoreductase family protein [Thermoplasmatales archaeon]
MNSEDLVEIVFHGRGGQGAVTAANLIVAAALKDGNKGVQAFPFFGAERRGAPVRAFARISHTEIHLRSEIYYPDIVIVLDESLMDIVDVLKGLKKDGRVLINTRKKPSDFDFSKKYKVATVDATGVALKNEILVGGIPVINTPILGAVPKILNRVTLKSIQDTIRKKWNKDLAERNVKATKDAYDLVEVKS